MMSHQSGLVRESPVGHYFDPTEPSLASNPYFLATRARRELGQERLEYLGVLGTDDTALYFGTLESVANGEHFLATVSGLTTVGGWLIGINISAPYQGGATIDMLLKQQQVNIQRLIDTNSSSPAGK